MTELKNLPFWGPNRFGRTVVLNESNPVLKDLIAFDVEDDENNRFVGLSIYDGGDRIYYYSKLIPDLKDIFRDKKLITHNGRYDVRQMNRWGVPVKVEQIVGDTRLAAYVEDCTNEQADLKSLAANCLGVKYPSYHEMVGKGARKITLDRQVIEDVAAYNCNDSYVTWHVWHYFTEKVFTNPTIRKLFDFELKTLYTIYHMEENGIGFDPGRLQYVGEQIKWKEEITAEDLRRKLGPINLNSPKQVLNAFHKKGIKPRFKGKDSVDKRAFSKFKNDPLVNQYLFHSHISTLIDSFINPLKEYGIRLYADYSQTRTRTGRLACKAPNIQQIPARTDEGKLIRSCFVPKDGYVFWDADFGQIEPRVMAHFSKDPALTKMFKDGVDFHDFTARAMKISRDKAKVLNLSVGYKVGASNVANQLGVKIPEAQKAIEKWWAQFPVLKKWEEELIEKTKQSGYVTTLYGRCINVPDLDSPDEFKRGMAERMVINNIIQGSAAEIMKEGMIALDRAGYKIVAVIHDEALGEILDGADHTPIKKILENCVQLSVPLVVDVRTGENWAAAKK